jgi:hypothetical protein
VFTHYVSLVIIFHPISSLISTAGAPQLENLERVIAGTSLPHMKFSTRLQYLKNAEKR